METVELPTQGWQPLVDVEGNAQGEVAVTIERLDGSEALAADTELDGTLAAALPEGIYDLTVNGETHRVHVVSGAPHGWYSVAMFGADASGATDATAACQECIDYVQNTLGGGVVFFPAGNYLINGGLTVGPGPPVRLIGAGMPMNPGGTGVGYRGTWLTRTAPGAGNTMISCTAAVGGTKGYVSVEQMGVHGGTQAGIGIDLTRCDQIDVDRVYITSVLDIGLRLRTVYNSGLGKIWAIQCGNGLSKPAVQITSASDATSGEGSATVHFMRLEIEASRGTDLELDGSTNNPANDIQFGELKIEGGTVGFTETCPMIRLRNCQNLGFSNIRVNAHTARTVPPIQEDRPNNSTRATKWSNLDLSNSGSQPFTYFMQLTRGAWTIASACFDGAAAGPTTAHIRVESTVSVGLFRYAACMCTAGKPLVSDARAMPTVAAATSITLPRLEDVVEVTGNTNIETITDPRAGLRVTLIFRGTPTVKDGTGNINLPADFVAAANSALTLVADGSGWYGSAPGSAN